MPAIALSYPIYVLATGNSDVSATTASNGDTRGLFFSDRILAESFLLAAQMLDETFIRPIDNDAELLNALSRAKAQGISKVLWNATSEMTPEVTDDLTALIEFVENRIKTR